MIVLYNGGGAGITETFGPAMPDEDWVKLRRGVMRLLAARGHSDAEYLHSCVELQSNEPQGLYGSVVGAAHERCVHGVWFGERGGGGRFWLCACVRFPLTGVRKHAFGERTVAFASLKRSRAEVAGIRFDPQVGVRLCYCPRDYTFDVFKTGTPDLHFV